MLYSGAPVHGGLMENREHTKLVTLIIMDGFGLAPPGPGNAILLARTPHLDHYMARYPHTELAASGAAVGLPPGEMGNSETGHMNFGAGRVVYQKLTVISQMIEDGSFFATPAFQQAIAHVRRNRSRLHLIGLIGPGGVHAYEGHLDALLKLAHDAELRHVYVQAILDGRDTEPRSALGYVRELNARMAALRTGAIATTSGRYYAMDRDHRWERTKLAYDAMAKGQGPTAPSAEEAVQRGYAQGLGDEHQLPTVITHDDEPVATVQPHDAVIFFNFRGDRPRQLTKAFVLPEFDAFDRGPRIADLFFVTLAEYEKGLPVVVAFPPERLTDPVTVPLARVVDATLARSGVALITADHGNAEQMLEPGGRPWTAHTSNPVPFILVAGDDHPALQGARLRDGGKLGDVSPTILELLELPQPPEMTGHSLISRQ